MDLLQGGPMEAQYFSFKYSCRVDKGRKWKPSQMKSQGSVSEAEEEEAVEDGVTRNPIPLEMLRWEGRRWWRTSEISQQQKQSKDSLLTQDHHNSLTNNCTDCCSYKDYKEHLI